MMGHELLRKLIVRAPLDLVTAIYARVRLGREGGGEGPSWQEIAHAAQDLGIFTPEEGNQFLRLISKGVQDAA